MYIYNWQIGEIKISICTNRKNLKLPHYPVTQIQVQKNIIIYLEEDIRKKEQLLKTCKETWNLCYPKELKNFYKVMNSYLIQKIHLESHVNYYYQKESSIVAYFPYYTDNFLLKYSYSDNIIKLYGNETNLYRILTDFASVNNKYLPLHASCLQKDKNVIGLVSTSGGGKTSLVLKLIQKGFNFVADDSLFMSQNKILPVSDLIAISKLYPNHPIIKRKIKRHKEEKVYIHLSKIAKMADELLLEKCTKTNFFYLQKRQGDWNGLKAMKEPFPCIAHHSFWCLHYFEENKQLEYIDQKAKASFSFWENKLQNIQPIKLNFSEFDKSVESFVKKIS